MANEYWRSVARILFPSFNFDKENKKDKWEEVKKWYKWYFITQPLLFGAIILIVVLFWFIWHFIKGLI